MYQLGTVLPRLSPLQPMHVIFLASVVCTCNTFFYTSLESGSILQKMLWTVVDRVPRYKICSDQKDFTKILKASSRVISINGLNQLNKFIF